MSSLLGTTQPSSNKCSSRGPSLLLSLCRTLLVAVLVVAVVLSPLTCAAGSAGNITSAEAYGVSFDYKLAWVDATNKRLGAEITPTFVSNDAADATTWYLALYYPQGSIISFSSASNDWNLSPSSSESWVGVASPLVNRPGVLYVVAEVAQDIDLASAVSTVGAVTQMSMYPRVPDGNMVSQLFLIPGADFQVNQGVDIADLPTSPPDSWGTAATITTATTSAAGENDDDDATKARSLISMGSNTNVSKQGGEEKQQVRYIKGNPDYDRSMNPLSRKLTGPLVGLFMYCSVAGVAILFYLIGTIIRIHYRISYYRLSNKMGNHIPYANEVCSTKFV
ncbi:hypothetical protein EV182_001179 [Spiromyces aspiralis]|uniref:Uncharacterized protein n=1 Tax=Spiromyces aspiralis TaxID=68401 RepID=A0ACC1HHH8_9FUNG|nr:hypothetical protein EV182_001179 [Spiromyces aspiralis]